MTCASGKVDRRAVEPMEGQRTASGTRDLEAHRGWSDPVPVTEQPPCRRLAAGVKHASNRVR